MTPARLRLLGGLLAVIVLLGVVLVVTRDDGDGEDASDVDTEEPSSSTTRSSTTTTEEPTSTTKATTTTAPTTTTAAPAPASTVPPTTAPRDPFSDARIRLVKIASLDHPIAMAVRPQDGSLWVALKNGDVCKLNGCTLRQEVAAVSTGNEQGLLGITFNPSGTRFYASYTNPAGDTRLDEFQVHADGRANLATRREIFREDQPEANHNGGNIVFGPGGRLYLGLGDGGGSGDQHGSTGNGQNPNTDLGKILRINPANKAVVHWVSGVRNPWRFSFDRKDGSLWVADVGQNMWEEVTYLPAGAQQGRNLGWRCFEGTHRFSSCTPSPSHTGPIHEYSHGPGCSITGGYVYRGSKIPNLQGAYLFADYCDGQIRGFSMRNGRVRTLRSFGHNPGNVVSFGQAANGELYVLTSSAVWRIDPT